MKRQQPWVRRGLATSVLLVLAVASHAAPAAHPDDARFAESAGKHLASMFALSNELALDPELRSAADRIGAAHLARVRALLPDWIREERAVQGANDSPNFVYRAVTARLVNEVALWQIEPGDAAYEQASLEAVQSSPSVCRTRSKRLDQDFARKILRIQAMPPASRKAALATEAALLARWGAPRSAVPEWPALHPRDVVKAALAGNADGARIPALSPVLASLLLTDGRPYEKMAYDERCLVQQWWLRASLAQGKSPDAALNAFRYGILGPAPDRFYDEADEEADAAAAGASGRPPYPRFAARFDVSGTTTVSRRFDAQGKPVEASIVKREIKVGGIRGVRPVAFEDVLDAVTLRYALQPGAAAPSGAAGPQVFAMAWTLDPPDGEKKPDTAAPSGGAVQNPKGKSR